MYHYVCMSTHTHNHDDDPFINEMNRSDELVFNLIRNAVTTHVDCYPFVLQLLREVLVSAQDAHSIGGSEPKVLQEIHQAVIEYVRKDDGASLHLIETLPIPEGDL